MGQPLASWMGLYDKCVTHYGSKNTQAEEAGKATSEAGWDTARPMPRDATHTLLKTHTATGKQTRLPRPDQVTL